MEKTMDCTDFRDDMLDVLYGEAEASAVERFDAHQAVCQSCRDELDGLRGVRTALQAWEAPTKARAPFWSRLRRPGLSQLAAAAAIVLAFGGGLAVSRAELRVRDGEIAFRFGNARD